MRKSVPCACLALALLTVRLTAAGPAATSQQTAPDAPPSLRFGTNIGHWLSQAKLDRDEMRLFFTEEDVRRIRAWGMDHIRVPVDYPLFTRDGAIDEFSEEGLGWIDRAAEWTATHGLSLVLDMHHLPGHHFMREATNSLWTTGAPERAHALALWKRLAARYRGRPHVVFELLNEPVAPEGQDERWHEFARELVAAIRSVNPDNWIMVGSNRWNSAHTFATLPLVDDRRIIYTFHFYEPFVFTHQRASWAPEDIKNLPDTVPYPGPSPSATLHTAWLTKVYGWMAERAYGSEYLRERLAPVLEFRRRHNVPVYCGEFGTVSDAPGGDRLRWYRDLTELFRAESIGYANWNYKSDNFGLVTRGGKMNETLLAAISGRDPRP
jgi:hypothetical protein